MFESLNREHLPNLNDVKKCTTIKVDGSVVKNMTDSMREKLLEKFEFIPPIFEEYVIKTDNIGSMKQAIETEYCDIKMTPEQREKVITKRLMMLRRQFKNFDDITCTYTLIKWNTETSFDLIYFDLGKKRLYISIQYVYDEQGNMTFDGDMDVLSQEWINSYSEEELNTMAVNTILFVLSVSDYLLNYTDKVEYILDDDKPFKKGKKASKDTKNTGTETQAIAKSDTESAKASKVPKTDRRNIYYKSKIKVYEVSIDDVLNYKKRKYRKIKQSWFVRGYYQRYGKEKIPRYIPPRINHRKGVTETPKIGNLYKLDVQADSETKPE